MRAGRENGGRRMAMGGDSVGMMAGVSGVSVSSDSMMAGGVSGYPAAGVSGGAAGFEAGQLTAELRR